MTLEHIKKMMRANVRQRLISMLLSERQGIPVAFVNHGHVTWVYQEGVSDISRVFRANTDQRFAIVRERGSYYVYDFCTAAIDNNLGRVIIDDPEVYPTEESAVMAAMLRA